MRFWELQVWPVLGLVNERLSGQGSPRLHLLGCPSDKWKLVSHQWSWVDFKFEMSPTSLLLSEAIIFPSPNLSFSLGDLNVIYNLLFFWFACLLFKILFLLHQSLFCAMYRHFFSPYKAFQARSPSAATLFLGPFLKGSYSPYSQLMAGVSLDYLA